MSNNVLIIAPHPDDESIGCGGTICLHVERGDRVTAVFLTSGELGLERLPREEAWQLREKEAEAAAHVLGLADLSFLRQPDWLLSDHVAEASAALRPIIARETPHTIFVPHRAEWHPDHKAALSVLAAALVGTDIPRLFAYEIWTPLTDHDHVRDITSTMSRKLHAIRCYRSQLDEFRYDRAARGLALYRGAIAARSMYAEVFADAALPGV